MLKNDWFKIGVVLFLMGGIGWGQCCVSSGKSSCGEQVQDVNQVLGRLSESAKELKSYQAKIEYEFSQPLFDSKTLRAGQLYYEKLPERSFLRINFQTLKQDEDPNQEYVEQYIFDGVWLTNIDHQLKTVKKRKLAEPNEPVDAFELASQNFPVIGFSNVNDLQKDFEVTLVSDDKQAGIKLHLKVKDGSVYKNDYSAIDFWVDEKNYLPARITTTTVDEEIYDIRFLDAKVNERIDKSVFELNIPEDFGPVQIIEPEKNK